MNAADREQERLIEEDRKRKEILDKVKGTLSDEEYKFLTKDLDI